MANFLQNVHIYWINLTNRPDRRNFMINSFKNYKLHHNIRITPNTYDIPWVSCIKSHFEAIHTAYQDNVELACFVEDDIDFSTLSINILDILQKLPNDWECFQVHYIEPTLLHSLFTQEFTKNYIIKGYFMSCACYFMNRRGMSKFLQKLAKYDVNKKRFCSIFKITENAKAEELVYRYVNTYTSLYPVINTIENYSGDITTSNQHINYLNMQNIQIIHSIPTIIEKIYDVSENIITIPYHLHWFSDFNKSNIFIKNLSKPRIIVKLHSGLGNRLFQFASIYSLSKEKDYTFETIHYKNNQHTSFFSEYINVYFKNFTKDFRIYREDEKIDDINNVLINYKEFNEPYLSEYKYNDFNFNDNNFVYIFNGFFQNESYFSKYSEEIKELLKEPDIVKNDLDTINVDCIDWNNTVAIHVRLGDYIENIVNKEKHFVDLNNYYKNSIEYIENTQNTQNTQNIKFIIISESTKDECIKNYEILKNYDKLYSNNNEITDLYFISRCKGVICSNSTFSWWGAYLGRNDKIITIPNKWLNDREDFPIMEKSKIINV
jgi:GR25 family glycosyltransferase involved in LPS biosynthesis